MIEALMVRVFIDSVLIHSWPCHRLPGRSFFLRGRQFHICARCTGIISSFLFSPFFFIADRDALCLFIIFLFMTATDGITQLLEWRESNNFLRFITGFGLGITFVVFLFNNALNILDILRKVK